MAIASYRDLEVWNRAMDLVVDCYKVTDTFPKSELYGLASQLQRAAVSVPANIAEGHGRDSTKEYLRHLSIAYGSLMELETQLIIAKRLHYLSEEKLLPIMESAGSIGRMLNALQQSLTRRLNQQQ